MDGEDITVSDDGYSIAIALLAERRSTPIGLAISPPLFNEIVLEMANEIAAASAGGDTLPVRLPQTIQSLLAVADLLLGLAARYGDEQPEDLLGRLGLLLAQREAGLDDSGHHTTMES
jgi:hypothetical protein